MANIPVSTAIDNLLKSTPSTAVTTVAALKVLGATTAGDASIVAADLANGAVTADKILDGSVTVGKIGSSAVTDTKLAANAVTTAKIVDGAVTATKIPDAALTIAKTNGLQTALDSKINNSVGFMEDFTNSVRWPASATITNNTTIPQVTSTGDPYWLNISGTASPAPSIQTRGYGAGANNQLWYLGSTVPTSGGKMSLGFKFEHRKNPTSVNNFNNTFNISFNRDVMMAPSTGSISPDGTVHMNFDRSGISSINIYNANSAQNTIITSAVLVGNVVTLTTQANHIFVHPAKITVAGITGFSGTDPNGDFTTTSATGNTITYTLAGTPTGTYGFASATVVPPVFTCLSHTAVSSIFPFTKQTQGILPLDRDFVVLIKVEGEYMTITFPTIGSFLFHSTALPFKIGAPKTYFWYEDLKNDAYSSWGFLKKIWGGNNSILDTDPDWGGFIGGNLTSLNTGTFHVLPGTVISNAANPSTLTGNLGLLMADSIPNVAYGFKAAAVSATSNFANGGNVFIEGAYLSNIGTTAVGGNIIGRSPMNIASGITTALSSTTVAGALLKSFTRIPTLANSDSQSIEIYGRLVGVLAKRINIILDAASGTLFDSDLTATPLNLIEGAYRIVIKRFSLSGSGSIFYTIMTLPDGTSLPMSRLSTNLTTENVNIRFQTTTAAAGGVTIEGAIQTVDKVINR